MTWLSIETLLKFKLTLPHKLFGTILKHQFSSAKTNKDVQSKNVKLWNTQIVHKYSRVILLKLIKGTSLSSRQISHKVMILIFVIDVKMNSKK